jgi:transposase-like protein
MIDAPAIDAGRNPFFSGVRMPDETKQAIIEAHGGGESSASIARRLGCSRNTVAAVIRDISAGRTVEQARRAAAGQARGVVVGILDRLTEALEDDDRMGKAGINHLAYALRQSQEAAALLGGQPTAIIRHETEETDPRALLLRLRDEAVAMDSGARIEPKGGGLGVGPVGQDLEAGAAGGRIIDLDPATDCESDAERMQDGAGVVFGVGDVGSDVDAAAIEGDTAAGEGGGG